MKISGWFWLLMVGFLFFSSCTADETKEDFADRLMDILIKDDLQTFKSSFLPDEALLVKLYSARSNKTNWVEARKAYENIINNAPGAFKRMAWRRISNGGTATKEIDWNKVQVTNIDFESEEMNGIEAGEMKIHFQYEDIECSLGFSKMIRGKDGQWKLFQGPNYGCMSGPYSKNIELK